MRLHHRVGPRVAAITLAVMALWVLAATPAAAATYCVSVNGRTVVCVDV